MRDWYLLGFMWFLLPGCVPGASEGPEVVVYAALDREFSQPVLADFSRQTGIRPRVKYDVESTKTVGLTQALIAERTRPRCDVFWNNEILNTLRLEEQGLLAVYRSPQATHYPELYRSPQGTWHGFAARARILLVNEHLVPEADRPGSLDDLTDVRWRGRIAIAKPLFGTTATHSACLFAYWGPARATEFFQRLQQNQVQVLSGNKQVAQAVAAGQVAIGLTDTDDAMVEINRGEPVAIVYPDRRAEQMGTLFIPNTVCLLRGAPHEAAGQKLIDFLLRPETELRLARSASAQIPLNTALPYQGRIATPQTVKAMAVDFAVAASAWDEAAATMRRLFAE